MYISYAKLWKLLLDKSMNKTDLIPLCGISSRTLSKLSKNQNVNTDTLLAICQALDCDISDIMEIGREEDAATLYEAFCLSGGPTSSDEMCDLYRFDFRGKKVILKKSVARANNHTVIHCGEHAVIWEQLYPVGVSPAREKTVLSDASFWEKGALCVIVVSGQPMGFQNLDEGVFLSCHREMDFSKRQIYVMSEARWKLFEANF